MKRLGVFVLLLDGMLVHHVAGLLPALNSPVPFIPPDRSRTNHEATAPSMALPIYNKTDQLKRSSRSFWEDYTVIERDFRRKIKLIPVILSTSVRRFKLLPCFVFGSFIFDMHQYNFQQHREDDFFLYRYSRKPFSCVTISVLSQNTYRRVFRFFQCL